MRLENRIKALESARGVGVGAMLVSWVLPPGTSRLIAVRGPRRVEQADGESRRAFLTRARAEFSGATAFVFAF